MLFVLMTMPALPCWPYSLPSSVAAGSGLRTLSFMDAGVIDYNAPILFAPFNRPLPPPKILWTTIQEALPRHDFVRLRKMPADIEGKRNPLCAPDDPPHDNSGHAISLPKSWAAMEERIGRHEHMRAWNRKLRRLKEIGPVKFAVPKDTEDRKFVLQQIVRQKRQRLQALGLTDIFDRPGIETFYENCAALPASSQTYLSSLSVNNNEIIAADFGFLGTRRLISALASFSARQWSRYSPGSLHFLLLLRWTIENGLSHLDLGLGDERYKSFWCDQLVPLYNRQQCASLSGRLYVGTHRALAATRAMGSRQE